MVKERIEEVSDEELLFTLDDILRDQAKVREGIFTMNGMKFRLVWASINDSELPSIASINKRVNSLMPAEFDKKKVITNEAEREEIFNRLYMDAIVWARIDKGQKTLEAPLISFDQWDALDSTVKGSIRNTILIGDIKDKENLDGGPKTLLRP